MEPGDGANKNYWQIGGNLLIKLCLTLLAHRAKGKQNVFSADNWTHWTDNVANFIGTIIGKVLNFPL